MSEAKVLTMTDIKALTVDAVGDEVANFISKGELVLSKNYSPVNALKSAWLILQEVEASYKNDKKDTVKLPALSYCTQNSVKLALMDMVIQGLSPSKKQCYFIAYGKKLQMFRSYFGTIAVLKRTTDVKDVYAQVIRKDDVFNFNVDHGVYTVSEHIQTLGSLDSEIIGAYATFVRKDGTEETEIMTMKQIENSWKKSKTVSYSSSTHKEFQEEMCKRTVLNRGAKLYLNTSDDSDLVAEAINREIDHEEEETKLLPQANSIEIGEEDYLFQNEDSGEVEDLEELQSNENTGEVDLGELE